MNALIISIFIIIIFLISVMTTMLINVTKVVNERIKSLFINKLEDYNNLIELKNKELQNITSSEENKESNIEKEVYHVNPIIDIPSYRDSSILKDLKKINEKFDFDNQNIILKFIQKNYKYQNEKHYNLLNSLNEKLYFDIVYEVMLYQSNVQYSFLKKIASKEELKYLENYKKEDFNILEFKNHIENLIDQNDQTIYVRVGKKEENYDHLNNNIKTIYDESIIKGIKIVYQNKLFDYSLW